VKLAVCRAKRRVSSLNLHACFHSGGDILAEIREDSRYDDVAIYATVRNKSLWPKFEAIRITPAELDLSSPQDLDAFIRERHGMYRLLLTHSSSSRRLERNWYFSKVKLVIETTDSATDNIAIPCIKALQANNGTYIAVGLGHRRAQFTYIQLNPR
jgi:hypothetical protein